MSTKRSLGAVLCFCLVLVVVGCGDDNVTAPAPPAPPAEADDEGPQLRSFSLDLDNIDDYLEIRVNGQVIKTYEYGDDPDPLVLDTNLVPGDNTLQVKLWNYGCFATSLDLAIRENGAITEPTRSFYRSVSDCGEQLTWIYHLNRETGLERVQ